MVLKLSEQATKGGRDLEDIERRKEAPVQVRPMRGEPQEKDNRSCLDCDHLIARRGFPHCTAYDKPTSLEVNWCHGYTAR